MILKSVRCVLFFLVFHGVSAQRLDILSGKPEALKGISEYNVIFDYTGMQIHGYGSEEAFLDEKAGKRQKTPEKAEAFIENWYKFRTEKYEPGFIAYFNARFADGAVRMVQDTKPKYTLKVKTTWLYPGYGIGVGGEEAKISATLTIFETADPSHVLVSIAYDKAIGLASKNYNDLGDRITGAYEKLAKNFAMQVKRFR